MLLGLISLKMGAFQFWGKPPTQGDSHLTLNRDATVEKALRVLMVTFGRSPGYLTPPSGVLGLTDVTGQVIISQTNN